MSAEDTVIRIAALKAAKDAADHMVKTNPPKPSGSMGAFALYTWGSLALVSAFYAAVLGIDLENLDFQAPQIAILEDLVPSTTAIELQSKPDPAASQVAQAAPVPEVAKVVVQELPSDLDAKLRSELSELPAPLVPKVELPKEHLAAMDNSPLVDEIQTGSVPVFDEDELQPFPDDLVPENLFAVDIGGAKAVAPLIGRYSALKRRAPDLFTDLEPRIQLKGANSSLEARLVAGPFTSQRQVAQFCRSLRLRLTVDCTMSSFEGDTIQ